MTDAIIDWDEILLVNNPDSKELEVSFKKIDGDGFLISGGSEPGTPGGANDPTAIDDEGDLIPIITPESPVSGGPIPPTEPELSPCAEHDCEAYDQQLLSSGGPGSNILRTSSYSIADNKSLADAWVTPALTGYWGVAGNIPSTRGNYLTHLSTFDGVVDTTTTFSTETNIGDGGFFSGGSILDQNQLACGDQYIWAQPFGTIRNPTFQSLTPGCATKYYTDTSENFTHMALGDALSANKPMFPNTLFAFDYSPLVEPWETAEFLTYENGTQLGLVPNSGVLKFNAFDGGAVSTATINSGLLQQLEFQNLPNAEVTSDYATEILSIPFYLRYEDNFFGPNITGTKTLSIPREKMSNVWIKSRGDVEQKIHEFPNYAGGFFIVYRMRCWLYIGDEVFIDVEFTSSTNRFATGFYDAAAGNFCKYLSPLDTGGSSTPNGLAFNGPFNPGNNTTGLSPVSLAATNGPRASDSERRQFARQFKTYITPAYCERTP